MREKTMNSIIAGFLACFLSYPFIQLFQFIWYMGGISNEIAYFLAGIQYVALLIGVCTAMLYFKKDIHATNKNDTEENHASQTELET